MEDNKRHIHEKDEESCACGCSQVGNDAAGACGCGHDHDEDDSALVTMVDEETGEEYTFEMVDSIELDGETYCLLATVEDEPEAVFVKVVTMEDGTEGLMSLEDDEFDRVSEAYDRMIEEDDEDDEDDEPEEDLPDEKEDL
jgi:uncharacterized protein YrzB (UPF0473 family)